MLNNISSSINTIIAVVVAYIIVVCTVRPLQNLIVYFVSDKTVKDEGKLWPNLFLHGNIMELIAISIMFFSNFKFPFFYWEKKPKELDSSPYLTGFSKFVYKHQELISYLVMVFIVYRTFLLLPYFVTTNTIKSLKPVFSYIRDILYLLILFDLAMSLSTLIIRKFLPSYANNFLVRILVIFACVYFIQLIIKYLILMVSLLV
jgi:hypothetical protein